MRLFISSAVLVTIIGLACAGHVHYDFGHGGGGHGGGGHGEEVSYSVATKHEHGGHGGGDHGAGHHSTHEWTQEGGHDGGHDFGGHDFGGHDFGGHDDGHDGGHDGGHDEGHDHHAHPKYEFDYGVKDPKTGDIKGHSETRDGHKVKGSYTFKEADGTTRLVEYSSDKKKGFTATVHKIGTPNADHGGHGHGGHGHEGHDYGHGGHGHGEASSFVVVKKHEEKKH